MKGTTLIETGDVNLVLRGYELGHRVTSNLLHVLTREELEYWERNHAGFKEAITRGFALENISTPKPTPEPPAFRLLKEVELVIPPDYRHEGFLGRLRAEPDPKRYHFNENMTDDNYSRPSRIIQPGDHFLVKFVSILRKVTSEQCLAVYREHQGHLTGAQGAGVLYKYLRNELPVYKWSLSFDEENRLWKNAGGCRGVPRVYRFSDDDVVLSLGSFECPWDDQIGRAH